MRFIDSFFCKDPDMRFIEGFFAKILIHDRAGGVKRTSFRAKLVNE